MDQIKVKGPFEIPHDGDELKCAARQRIDDDIYNLEHRILSLKTKRNQLSPISVLPAEVLSTIFILARDQSIKVWFPNRQSISWINVTHVCRHWREVALECPRLWTAPIFAKPNLSQEMMKRSKMAGLTIKLATNPLWDPRVLEELENAMGQIHRVESIQLSLYRIKKFETIFPPLSRPAPLLESLSLADSSRDGDQSTFPADALSDAPRLRSVDFIRLNFSWESPVFRHRNLTKLWLTDNCAATDGTSSFTQMMDALCHLPNLRVLHLNNSIPPHTTSNGGEKSLKFKFLEHLELRANAVDCILFLTCIQYPPRTIIRLYSSSTTLEDSHTIFSLVGQNLHRAKSTETGAIHSPVLIHSVQLAYTNSGAPEITLFSRGGAFTSIINIALSGDQISSRAHDRHITSLCSCFDLSSLVEIFLDWDFSLHEADAIRDSLGKLSKLKIIATSRSLLSLYFAIAIPGSPKDSLPKGPEEPQTRYPLRSRKSEHSLSFPVVAFPALRTLVVTDQDFRQHRHPEGIGILLDILVRRSNMNAPIDILSFAQCRGMRTSQKRQLAELVVRLEVEFKVIDIEELDAVDDDEEEGYYSDEDEEGSEDSEDTFSDDPWNIYG